MANVTSSETPLAQNPNLGYVQLVTFLVQPFLDSPDALRVDCEWVPAKSRAWIRLAFDGSDKGRVFGRGGRTIQAIRTILETAAQAAGHSVYLDIYGGRESAHEAGHHSGHPAAGESKSVPQRPSPPKRPSKPSPPADG